MSGSPTRSVCPRVSVAGQPGGRLSAVCELTGRYFLLALGLAEAEADADAEALLLAEADALALGLGDALGGFGL